MKTYISLLRGINVSGQKKISMADLRELYRALGLVDARTYVQSGNVIFTCLEPDMEKLARMIEKRIAQIFKYRVPVLLRSAVDLQRILAENPFRNERNEDPGKLHVTFLSQSPARMQRDDTTSMADNGDEFIVREKEIYVFCPNGYGRTKWTNNYLEKKLQVAATTRNWKTVTTLYAMATGQDPDKHIPKN